MRGRWHCGARPQHWPCTVTVAVAVAVAVPGSHRPAAALCQPHGAGRGQPLRMRNLRTRRLQILAGAAAAAHAWGRLCAAILKSEPQAGRRRGRSILGGGGGGGGRRSGGACGAGGQPGVRGSPGEGGQ